MSGGPRGPWARDSQDGREVEPGGTAPDRPRGSPEDDPAPEEPEDDLALARMVGTAILLGILFVLGLIFWSVKTIAR